MLLQRPYALYGFAFRYAVHGQESRDEGRYERYAQHDQPGIRPEYENGHLQSLGNEFVQHTADEKARGKSQHETYERNDGRFAVKYLKKARVFRQMISLKKYTRNGLTMI